MKSIDLLGAPVAPEERTPDGKGRYRFFQLGMIIWKATTGVHELHGGIYQRWRDLGAERSELGYPLSDVIELRAPRENGHVYWAQFENGVIYWIYQPNVKRHETSYDQVRFRENDKVTVTATGCVQTGGKSATTWKRYVDPIGPKADSLYHGLISIPLAVWELTRIHDVMDRPLLLSAKIDYAGPMCLILGYEDDQYDDNGYYDHDDGISDQCRGLGNAEVTITIIRSGATRSRSPANR